MTLTLILPPLLLSFLFLVMNRIRLASVSLTLALGLLWVCGSAPVARALMSGLQLPLVGPRWSERNAIIVLGLGTVRWPNSDVVTTHALGLARVMKAAELYRACRSERESCRVLPTGGDPSRTGQPEGAVMTEDLVRLGVARADILPEVKSMNTYQNAQFSRDLLESYKPERVVLVTSGFHLRRSVLYFAHFFKSAVPVSSDFLSASRGWRPSARNLDLVDIAMHEWLGVMRFDVYNWLGWNAPPPGGAAGAL